MRISLLAVLAAVVLVGCGGEADGGEPETQSVTVTFHLADYDTAFFDCEGAGGYSDIGTGTPVVIKNGSGDVLGASKLDHGRASDNGVQAAFCDWEVDVDDVPTGEDFYTVEIASRGEITSSRSDLAENNWKFEVSLGDAS